MVPLEDVETVVDEVVLDVGAQIDSDAVELWLQCTHRDMLTLGLEHPKVGYLLYDIRVDGHLYIAAEY